MTVGAAGCRGVGCRKAGHGGFLILPVGQVVLGSVEVNRTHAGSRSDKKSHTAASFMRWLVSSVSGHLLS